MITSDPVFVKTVGPAGYAFALSDMEHGPGAFENL